MKVDLVVDKNLIGNYGKTATEFRFGKKQTLFHCCRVFKTREEMEKAEHWMAVNMFDDQRYKIVKGKNGYGFCVETIYLGKEHSVAYMMADPYFRKRRNK